MKRLLLAALLALGFGAPVQAQTLVNPGCNTIVTLYPSASRGQPISVDAFGATCSVTTFGAGTAIIGKVGIDQTTPGTTNGVQVNAALPAGANIIGKTGIDQTTPGTTNLVALAANQSVNVAQINAVAPLMGNGVTGTGSPRVTIASDNTAFSVNAVQSGTWTVQPGNTANTTAWLMAHNATASIANGNGVIVAPTANAADAITPVVCGSAVSSCVLKASTGNLYSVYAECSAACWLQVFNATAAPTNGATTAGVASGNMVECIPINAGGAGSISSSGMPPSVYTVGITATISSTTCATLTLATTGFINGKVK